MMKFLPRTGINSPRLVRLLAELAIAEVPESKQSLAERLGHWLDLTDAIALSGALAANAGGAAGGGASADGAVADEVARVRTALAESIAAGAGGPGRARVRLPVPGPGATLDTVADFAPFRRYYVAYQRDMETAIGPLRAKLRQALAARSPALAQLAALDAVMERTLAERERLQLGAVPFLLEKHFERRRQAYRQALADTAQTDDPARWMQPGGWLAAFCRDLQRVLLAELELRLQPVLGLADAYGAERPGEAAAPPFAAAGAEAPGGPSFS